jgi:hypothetical protein
MAATNVQAFSGDVEISSNVTAANSKFSLDTNGTFKQDNLGGNGRYIKLMKYFGDASNWKIATGSYTGPSFQWLSIRAKMTRLDVDVETIQFNYYGHNGISRVRDSIVIGGGGSATQANEIKVYNKTSNSTYEIYLQIDTATSVEVEISHRYSTIDDDYSTVATANNGAIDETGLTKIYDSGTTTDLRLRSGNIGIGLTNPSTTLEINGSVGIGRAAGGYTFREIPGGGLRAGVHSNSANDLIFRSGGDNEAVRIFSNGNVGIGTTNPDARLHLEEPSDISATTRLFHTENGFSGGSVGHFEIIEKKTGAGTGWSDFTLRLQRRVDDTEQGYIEFNPTGSNGDYGMAFGTGTVETMRLDALNGKVGIGTNSPSLALHVHGSSTNHNAAPDTGLDSGLIVVRNTKTGSSPYSMAIGVDQSHGFGYLNAAGNNQVQPICINTRGGNVGIGVTNPGGPLDIRTVISDPSVPTVHIGDNAGDYGDYGMVNLVRRAADGGSKAHLAFVRSGNTIFSQGYYNNTNTFGFWPSFTTVTNAPAMAISSSGYVGIGKTNPDYKLDVNGSARIGKTGFQTAPGNEAIRVYNGNYPAAYFESYHSLGLTSIVTATPSTGAAYNNTSSYKNNAVYRSDVDGTANANWKHFSGVSGGGLTFYVRKDGYAWGNVFENRAFDFFLGTGDQSARGDSGLSRALVKDGGNILRINYNEDFEGGTAVAGSFSKGSGSFKIDHPLPDMEETHHLVHSFIEGPQADNIYRGVAQLTDGSAAVNIDEASRMTEGTFVALNRRTQCFTTNETDWDHVRGTLSGNILTIECQNSLSTATVSWLVIGERQDKHMFGTRWTDDEGRVITEPLKDFVYDDTDYQHALRDISDN